MAIARRFLAKAAKITIKNHDPLNLFHNSTVTPKGVYVRVLHPPVEGMVSSRSRKVEAGERVTVRLAGVNVEKGYLDFVV